MGISRTEYLRRHLHREARRTAAPVTPENLRAMAELLSDLGDAIIMTNAWA